MGLNLRRKRRRLYEAAEGRCSVCFEKIAFEQSTADHILPRSLGGTNKMDNLRLTCFWCNQRSGRKLSKTNNRLQKTLRNLSKRIYGRCDDD